MAVETPKIVYATFAGMIDQMSLTRIFHNFSAASQGGTETIHLLFQSTGGMISDGISLYNFFNSLPLILHIYNTGSVQSIAVLGYLGADCRHTSAYGTFMIHKSHFSAQTGISAAKFEAMAKNLTLEDSRVEAILKENTNIPEDKWALHALQDVTFSAQEAVDFGIAFDICEWNVPAGNQIFNI